MDKRRTSRRELGTNQQRLCTQSLLRISLFTVIIISTCVLFSMQHAQFQRAWQQLDNNSLSVPPKPIQLMLNHSDSGWSANVSTVRLQAENERESDEGKIGERQIVFEASKIERKEDQVIREESISYTHKISEKKISEGKKRGQVAESSVVPKVALMFIAKGVVHNEPSWRAFFEAAGRLQLKNQPPNFKNTKLEEIYGALHPALQTLREDQYPGWKILHGIIDPMTFKFLDLDKDIPSGQLAELIVDPIRYGYDVIRDTDRFTRREILRLLSVFRGLMIKSLHQRDISKTEAPLLFPDMLQINRNSSAKELLNRFDILENNNTLVSEQEYYIQQFVQLVNLLDPSRFLTGREVYEAQSLFSLYVHPLPGYFYPKGSLFEGRELLARVNTTKAFAQHMMVEAEMALLREALRDANNHKFVLLSENCVPLRPPEVVWAQLMSERTSRVDACRHERGPLNLYRWKKQMRTDHLSKKHWRKSQQWFVLNRPHAELVVRDSHVSEMFKRYCWSYYDPIYMSQHVCISDEHVIPTLLATYGLDYETDCQGVGTYTNWKRGGWHPHTYIQHEIRPRMMREARGPKPECNMQSTIDLARSLFDIIVESSDQNDDNQIDQRTLDHQEQMIASMQARVKSLIGVQKKQQGQSNSGLKPTNMTTQRRLLLQETNYMIGGQGEQYASQERERIDDTYTIHRDSQEMEASQVAQNVTNNTRSDDTKDRYLSNAEKLLVELMNRQQGIGTDKETQLGRDDPTITSSDVLQQDYMSQMQNVFMDQQKQMQKEEVPDKQWELREYIQSRIPKWIESLGYEPFSQDCSLFARKFPPQASVQTLKMVLDCDGGGLGWWCYQNWLDTHQ